MRIFGLSIQKSSTVDQKDHEHYKALGQERKKLVSAELKFTLLYKTIDIIEAFVADRDKANGEVSKMLSRDFTLTQIENALADQPHLKAQVKAVMKRMGAKK